MGAANHLGKNIHEKGVSQRWGARQGGCKDFLLLGLTFLAAGPKVVLVMGKISWITWRQLGVKHKFVPLFPIAGGRGVQSGEQCLGHRYQEQ